MAKFRSPALLPFLLLAQAARPASAQLLASKMLPAPAPAVPPHEKLEHKTSPSQSPAPPLAMDQAPAKLSPSSNCSSHCVSCTVPDACDIFEAGYTKDAFFQCQMRTGKITTSPSASPSQLPAPLLQVDHAATQQPPSPNCSSHCVSCTVPGMCDFCEADYTKDALLQCRKCTGNVTAWPSAVPSKLPALPLAAGDEDVQIHVAFMICCLVAIGMLGLFAVMRNFAHLCKHVRDSWRRREQLGGVRCEAPAAPPATIASARVAASAPGAASPSSCAAAVVSVGRLPDKGAEAALPQTTIACASSSSSAVPVGRLPDPRAEVDLSFAKLEGKPLKFIRRAMGEARRLMCPQGLEEAKKGGYSFSLLDRDNLAKWAVRLSDLNPDGNLAKDLARYELDPSIDLEVSLPDGFPFEPPFVRVVYPQLEGGYVFSHGGICFEPLTVKGWAPPMTLPALATAIKGIFDYNNVRVAGAGDREKRTVPGYTEDGARKDHSLIVAAHKGGEGNTYRALKHYSS